MNYLAAKYRRGWGQHPGYHKGGAQESTTTTQNFSPEESARRTQVADEALRVYNENKDLMASKPYPGAAPVPFSTESVAAQNMQTQNALDAYQMLPGVYDSMQYGLTGAMDVNNNHWLQQAVQGAIHPILQDWTDTGGVMSGIRDAGVNSGQFGSSRQGIAEGIAAGRYAQAIGDVGARMYSDAYNKGQDTFARTLALAPQTMQMASTPVNWLSTVGAQKEDYLAQLAQYEADANMWDINSQWMPLNNLANIVYGGGSSQGTSTSNMAAPPTNRAAGAIGGAMAGAAMGAQYGSSFGWYGAAAGAVLGALMA